MFSWLWRKRAEKVGSRRAATAPAGDSAAAVGDELGGAAAPARAGENPANPGFMARGEIAFDNGRRTLKEKFDCLAEVTQVLEKRGHRLRVDGDVVVDEASGLSLRPLVAGFQPIHDKGIRTTTTIEIKHPTAIREPIFEYQHSAGDTMSASISSGFELWYRTDFVTVVDATLPEPRTCMVMLMEAPASADRPALRRRIVFGPVAHYRQHPPQEKTGGKSEKHSFCPCCLLTRSIEAFKPMIESRGLFALRLYATRDPSGAHDADCRVNGEDFDAGKAALKRYVGTWPQAGVEFRKQYVIVQDAPEGGGGAPAQPDEPEGAMRKELEAVGV